MSLYPSRVALALGARLNSALVGVSVGRYDNVRPQLLFGVRSVELERDVTSARVLLAGRCGSAGT